ncbi:hypothetical protein [Glaciihabitans sp. UYNi722]|uniref:hypothetical protein n=1 Tax=Glaciihabitans sp. UYNi722 TaxID=3156344 RepID=UPI0033962AB9
MANRSNGKSVVRWDAARGVARLVLSISDVPGIFGDKVPAPHPIAAPAILAGGVAILLGWKPRPSMIGRAPTGHGFGSVYGVGAFSGAANSRSAPVLIGENHVLSAPCRITENRLIADSWLSNRALGRHLPRLTNTN